MSFEINEVYELLQKNKWDEILKFEKEYREEIIKNNNLLHMFNTFFLPQVIKYSKTLEKYYSHIMLKNVYFHFLHIRNTKYTITNELFNSLIEEYISSLINVQKEKEAYLISKKWQRLDISQKYIYEYEKNNLKEIDHHQYDSVQMKTNNPQDKKLQIPLFKSNQEIEFFYALREYFPNYLIYPNVALSCIIDYNEIKDILSYEESKYFFTAIIDCVIFKQEDNNFYPEMCFELDSIFHDEEKQIKNDKLKNQILTKSGHNIFRIRSKNNITLKREELKKLIKEILSK